MGIKNTEPAISVAEDDDDGRTKNSWFLVSIDQVAEATIIEDRDIN